jgi:serine/threonine-protein kinase
MIHGFVSKIYFKLVKVIVVALAVCAGLEASWTNQIIAGSLGQAGYSGDGGPATSARLAQPRAVAFDSISNSLFIADSANRVVQKVSENGIISTLPMGGLQNPQGLCLNSTGKLYLADQGGNVIRMYDTTNNFFTPNFITGVSAQSVCVDQYDNIYVARNSPARVSKYSPTGALMNADFITGLNNPKGIWADSGGNIYVADASAHRVGKYTVAKNSYNPIFITGMNSPFGVSGDSLGNIYVANTNGNSVLVRSASGTITTFVSGLNNPQGIFVATIING